LSILPINRGDVESFEEAIWSSVQRHWWAEQS